MELLHDYARNHSEQAFRTLVERHLNIVYAVALRQTGHAQLAEDVAQTVFVDLARKATSLPKGTILAGWLFRATRYAAANARRAENRREHWEQKAAQMEPLSIVEPDAESAERITPMLNEALEELPETDRAAILLRFFERKSMGEVGRTLGTTEGAAKMRLWRAVEKLRCIFQERGVVLPASVVLGVLTAQVAQPAPAGLAASIATTALLNQSGTSTFILTKGVLKLMALLKAKKLAAAAVALLFGGTTALMVQQAVQRSASAAEKAEVKPAADAATNKVLVFRNVPSWNRSPDFEDTLIDLAHDFEVKPSSLMGTTDLSAYRLIVIPGAQWKTDFYQTYAANAARFNRYVSNGGVLVLELNGAENDGIPLPRGVNLVRHGATENSILLNQHPVVTAFGEKLIHANYASHGYLADVPKDALVIATESTGGESDATRPTFVEYSFGKGRVIAACQCFHDRDNSGRGAMMQPLLSYATERKWYTPKK